MPSVHVRFMTLTGKFRTLREADFTNPEQALEAIQQHAASAGFTNVKGHLDSDDWRYTATTPNGRHGRNIAYAAMQEQSLIDIAQEGLDTFHRSVNFLDSDPPKTKG